MKMDNNMLMGLVLVVLLLLVLGWNFYSGQDSVPVGAEAYASMDDDGVYETYENTAPQAPVGTDQPTHVDEEEEEKTVEGMQNPDTCHPKDSLSPEELLPQDYSSTWAKCNPMGAGGLEGKNFLDAGHHIGINTVGQTLRNSNLSLRSEPPNPQVVVSPWAQSTISPDTSRRYFEVGSC